MHTPIQEHYTQVLPLKSQRKVWVKNTNCLYCISIKKISWLLWELGDWVSFTGVANCRKTCLSKLIQCIPFMSVSQPSVYWLIGSGRQSMGWFIAPYFLCGRKAGKGWKGRVEEIIFFSSYSILTISEIFLIDALPIFLYFYECNPVGFNRLHIFVACR